MKSWHWNGKGVPAFQMQPARGRHSSGPGQASGDMLTNKDRNKEVAM